MLGSICGSYVTNSAMRSARPLSSPSSPSPAAGTSASAGRGLNAGDRTLGVIVRAVTGALRARVPGLPADLVAAVSGPRGPDTGTDAGGRAPASAGRICEALAERQVADRREQAVGEQRLFRSLQFPHGLLHPVESLERVPDADRQFDEYQSEAVAERRGTVLRDTQVDRHGGAQCQAGRVITPPR